jgi:F-type H+-transporting ATPase subunit b
MSELLGKLGIDWRLLIAQIVNFGILFLVLRHFLYRPVLKFLAERQERIAKGIADAALAAERLRGVELERQEVLHRAEVERQGVLERVAAEAEALHRERLATAEHEASAVVNRGRVEVLHEREEMLVEVRRSVGDLLTAVTRKVTSERLPKRAQEELVAAAAAEFEQAKLS